MGIIAGMSLMGLYVASEVIMFLYPGRFSNKELPALSKPDLVRLLLILLASILVMLVNPNFYQTYIYAYEHTKIKMLETVTNGFHHSVISILTALFH